MTPLYVETHGDLRGSRATADEIRTFVDGQNASYERLVSIDIVDGELVTKALTADELRELGQQLSRMQADAFRGLLEDVMRISKVAKDLAGVTFLLAPMQVRSSEAPYAEKLILEWADKHGLDVEPSKPPTKPGRWVPELKVRLKWRTIVELTYPAREANTEAVVEEEIATVTAERETAEQEMGAL